MAYQMQGLENAVGDLHLSAATRLGWQAAAAAFWQKEHGSQSRQVKICEGIDHRTCRVSGCVSGSCTHAEAGIFVKKESWREQRGFINEARTAK